MEVYPQTLVNVRVSNKHSLFSNSRIGDTIEHAKALIGEEGRIFVRPSGTEPLIRILGEGPEESVVRTAVSEVAKVIREELG